MQENLKSNLSPELEKALIDLSFINEIPSTQRSNSQKDRLREVQDTIREHYRTVWELVVAKSVNRIDVEYREKFGRDGDLRRFIAILENPDNSVPSVPLVFNTQTITASLANIAKVQFSVGGMLEDLEPWLDKVLDIEKRAREVWKGIAAFDREWKGDAVFHILFPEETYRQLRELEEIVARGKRRLSTLAAVFATLSRSVTVNTQAGDGELNRVPTGPPGFGGYDFQQS